MSNVFTRVYEKNALEGMKFEHRVFVYAEKYITGYGGGQWERDEKLAWQDGKSEVRLQYPENDCDVFTDLKSATIAVFIMAMNHMIWAHAANDDLCAFFNELWKEAVGAYRADTTLDRHAIERFLD